MLAEKLIIVTALALVASATPLVTRAHRDVDYYDDDYYKGDNYKSDYYKSDYYRDDDYYNVDDYHRKGESSAPLVTRGHREADYYNEGDYYKGDYYKGDYYREDDYYNADDYHRKGESRRGRHHRGNNRDREGNQEISNNGQNSVNNVINNGNVDGDFTVDQGIETCGNSQLNCCNHISTEEDEETRDIFRGFFGDIGGAGISCSPLNTLGLSLGSACSQKVACCQGDTVQNGLINFGCGALAGLLKK